MTHWNFRFSHNWKQHLSRSVYFHFPCIRVERKKIIQNLFCFLRLSIDGSARAPAMSLVLLSIDGAPILCLSFFCFCFSFDCFDWTAPRKSTVFHVTFSLMLGVRLFVFISQISSPSNIFDCVLREKFPNCYCHFCMYMYVFNLWFSYYKQTRLVRLGLRLFTL